MKGVIYRNEKNQAKWDAMLAEKSRLDKLAMDNGYKPETKLKAGTNSVYGYSNESGIGLGFDSKGEARDHFLRAKGLL